MRPRAYGVTYFPHVCEHGKSMFVLESRYGNDGYALWWKLLEAMGRTEGLYLDMNDDETVDWLCAKARMTTDRLLEILGAMARLRMVDRGLWQEKKLWSQNFVDGVAEVYARRRLPLPRRPGAVVVPMPPAESTAQANAALAPIQTGVPADRAEAHASRSRRRVYLVCGERQVSEAYFRRVVGRMGGDEYRAQAVFFRAFTQDAADPIAWIEAGLSSYALHASAAEERGRAVVDEWFNRCREAAETFCCAAA